MNGQYGVIVVDPPWSYGAGGGAGVANAKYETIGNGAREINRNTGAGIESIISATPVGDWASPNGHLYLWTTNPKLPFAFDVMKAWGFTYKTTLTWVKTRADGGVRAGGMGWFFRGATEHILFGVRGRKPIPAAIRVPNVIMAQPTRHSEKPVAAYDLLRSIYGPEEKMLDVYARRSHDRFDAWGNEATE